MAIMSFSNAPDRTTLGRVAGALAVDEAFVEKDWYVVQAIKVLIALADDDIAPVFSGGTSLLKGHGLIKRFSEDIDFKLTLSAEFLAKSMNQQRQALSTFRKALVQAWTEAGFVVTSVESRDGNGFIKIEMDYPTMLEPHGSLRPHILAELSAKPPRRAVQPRSLTSFVAQYRRADAEVMSIACVDPVETAADKLSAFAWRMLIRDRTSEKDDPTIIRHLHDLAALEDTVGKSAGFSELLASTLEADTHRGGTIVAALAPADRLAVMRAKLEEDEAYPDEYRRFVEGMAFAGVGEIPSFDAARAALGRLCDRLET